MTWTSSKVNWRLCKPVEPPFGRIHSSFSQSLSQATSGALGGKTGRQARFLFQEFLFSVFMEVVLYKEYEGRKKASGTISNNLFRLIKPAR